MKYKPGVYNYETQELIYDEEFLESFLSDKGIDKIFRIPYFTDLNPDVKVLLVPPTETNIIKRTLESDANHNIASVYISKKVQTIGDGCFNKLHIEKVIFEERDGTPLEIGVSAFANCKKLTQIDFPKNTIISPYAFDYSGLETLDLSEVYLSNYAFLHCKNLKYAYINVPVLPASLFVGSKLTEVEFGKEVKSIDESAFERTELEHLVMPENLQCISTSSFMNCKKLKSVDFKNVRSIGFGAFAGCDSLESVNVANKIHMIKQDAFAGCKCLRKFYLPASLKESAEVNSYAFGVNTPFKPLIIGNEKMLNRDFLEDASKLNYEFDEPDMDNFNSLNEMNDFFKAGQYVFDDKYSEER